MPVYFDRDNLPIPAEQWRSLYRDQTYNPTLARHKGPGWEVEASWVGWCSSSENPPRPFLVRTLTDKVTAGVKEAHKDFPDLWCQTPEEAKAKAGENVVELCRREVF